MLNMKVTIVNLKSNADLEYSMKFLELVIAI